MGRPTDDRGAWTTEHQRGSWGGLLAFVLVLAALAAEVWFMWPSGNVYRP